MSDIKDIIFFLFGMVLLAFMGDLIWLLLMT